MCGVYQNKLLVFGVAWFWVPQEGTDKQTNRRTLGPIDWIGLGADSVKKDWCFNPLGFAWGSRNKLLSSSIGWQRSAVRPSICILILSAEPLALPGAALQARVESNKWVARSTSSSSVFRAPPGPDSKKKQLVIN